jgi:hypothetical protein
MASYSYLALPYYYSIIPYIPTYQTIYLHLRDPYLETDESKVIQMKEEVLKQFDDFYDFHCEEYHTLAQRRKRTKLSRLLFPFRTASAVRKYKASINEFLSNKKPKAVISSSDLSINDKIAAAWCRQNNVPFLIIQPAFLEGVVAGSNRSKVTFPRLILYYVFNKILGAPIFLRHNIYGNEAQWGHLLLWGDYFKLDRKRKHTYIVGNPVFDKFFNDFSDKKPTANQIVFCTQEIDKIFGRELFDKVNRILLHAIQELPEFTFYIKVHPREDIEKYENVFSQSKYPNLKVVKTYNLYQLFKESALQISVMSFTSMEAAALGIPIITIAFPEFYENNVDHFRGEIDLRVTDIQEIKKQITYAVSAEYWEEFLQRREKYFNQIMHSMDGKSSERAAKSIISIISNK